MTYLLISIGMISIHVFYVFFYYMGILNDSISSIFLRLLIYKE